MSEQIKEQKNMQTDKSLEKQAGECIVEAVDEHKKVRRTKKSKVLVIGTVMVVVIAVLIGLHIYNLPTNRLNRQLDLGQKYLEEQNYEQAIVAFNEAIKIDDRCLEAYVGGIEAYIRSEDAEELILFYEKALDVARSIDGDVLDENRDYVCYIFGASDKVYDDLIKITEILEEGLKIVGDNQEIKQKLIENYLELAKQYADNATYDDALKIYDRLLELDSQNKSVLSNLSSCLTKYIEKLIAEKNFEAVRAIIEKYKGYELDIDFNAYLAQITELERIETEIMSYMNKVYEGMAAEDYVAMGELYYSEETTAFMELIGDRYIYFPQNDSNGVGAYKYTNNDGEESIYFYYGEYQDEIRVGSGKSFGNCGDCHEGICIFQGDWSEDNPNGYGEERVSHNNGSSYAVTSGMLVNGIWDGEIQRKKGYFNLPFVVENGVPQDRTDAFLASLPFVFMEIPEDIYIYAYDIVNYDIMFCEMKKGYTLGTIGYGGPIEE